MLSSIVFTVLLFTLGAELATWCYSYFFLVDDRRATGQYGAGRDDEDSGHECHEREHEGEAIASDEQVSG